jgi:hypothetical protein
MNVEQVKAKRGRRTKNDILKAEEEKKQMQEKEVEGENTIISETILVVQEINKYLNESIIDLSKVRLKIPNLPPVYRVIQPKDIIPFFINNYTDRMDIITKYIDGYVVPIDGKLNALLFIVHVIDRSQNTDEVKSELYRTIFEIYKL